MTDNIAQIAATAPESTVLPDDDDVLGGDYRTGTSIHTQVDRIVDMYSVDHLVKHMIGPWWSRTRDKQLRKISYRVDYIGIGVYNAVTKVTSIIPYIEPEKHLIGDDLLKITAIASTKLLQSAWLKTIPGMLFDVMTQDNGGFLEVIGGGGRSWEPLPPVDIGNGVMLPAVSLKNIDSQRVVRTGNPVWPVRVDWTDGNSYVMHHSRIIDFAQLPSTDPEMNGVGFCAVSRVINSMMQGGELDQILLDILSTGLTGEIILASPFESQDLEAAYKKAEQRASDPTEANTQKYVFVGVQNYDGKLQVVRIPLRRVPEGMNKSDMTAVLMQMMASALSIDYREIFAAPVSGNAKSDAAQNDKKSKSKFIKEWTLNMRQQLSFKFASIGTHAIFDHTDPAELQEVLDGRRTLAETHKIELENGTIDVNTAVKQLVTHNFLNDEDARRIQETGVSTQRVNNLFLPARVNRSLVTKQDEEAYLADLITLVNSLKSGELTDEGFYNDLSMMNREYVIRAYEEGSLKRTDQFGPEDFDALEDYLEFLDERILALREYISTEDDEDKILNRASLWQNMIMGVYFGSMLMRDDQETVFRWTRNPLKDSCEDCINYDGQEKTLAEWNELGVYPRSHALACTGIRCGCEWFAV